MLLPHLKAQINAQMTSVKKELSFYGEIIESELQMGLIVSMLNWTRTWPEPLLQAFFIAAKCIWLVHLLAFSFNPPLAIFRVNKASNFDPVYMEDILTDRHKRQVPSKVRIMVMPGFYVHDDILRCKVLCWHKSGAWKMFCLLFPSSYQNFLPQFFIYSNILCLSCSWVLTKLDINQVGWFYVRSFQL